MHRWWSRNCFSGWSFEGLAEIWRRREVRKYLEAEQKETNLLSDSDGLFSTFGSYGERCWLESRCWWQSAMGSILGKDAKATKGRGVCKLGWHLTGGEIFLFLKPERAATHMGDSESKFCGCLLERGHRQTKIQTVSLPFLRSSEAEMLKKILMPLIGSSFVIHILF